MLHCAIEPSLADESGHIYRNCELYVSVKELDPKVALQLWEVSEKMTAAKETAK